MKNFIEYFLCTTFYLGINTLFGQSAIYVEDFTGQAGQGFNSGVTNITTATWTLNTSAATGNGARFEVVANTSDELVANRLGGEAIWLSPSLNIAGYSGLTLSVNTSDNSQANKAANNSVNIEYSLDNGAWTAFATNGTLLGAYGTNITASQALSSGSTLQIRIRVTNDHANDEHVFDNISVSGTLVSMIYSGGTWNFVPDLSVTSANADIVVADGEVVVLPLEVLASNLTVGAGANVTVSQLELSGNITNNGVINVPVNATLMQTGVADGNSGSGLYTVQRRHVVRDSAAITVWGSPIQAQSVENAFPSSLWMFAWDDVNQAFINYRSGTMTPGRGYSITPDTSVYRNNKTHVVTFSGVLNNGPINYTVSNINGGDWIQIANPYPSSINWTEFVNDNPNLVGTYYCWDETSDLYNDRGYSSYNGSGGVNGNNSKKTAPTNFLPAMQGFFVQVAPGFAGGALTVVFENDQRSKIDNTQANFRKTNSQKKIWLTLESDSSSNEVLLNFDPSATDGFDALLDGISLMGNGYHNSYFKYSDDNYAILALAALELDSSYCISYVTDLKVTGEYSIRIDSLSGWGSSASIQLLDKDHDKLHDLLTGGYTFDVQSPAVLMNRFKLLIEEKSNTIGINDQSSDERPYWYQKSQRIIFNGTFQELSAIDVYGMDNRLVKHYSSVPSYAQAGVELDVSDLKPGVYVFHFHCGRGENLTYRVVKRN